ncbi:hypothetical protein COOONC_01009, partial [Cooperia oncophora]
MEALETSAAGEVYEKVKESALRLERSISECKNATRTKPTQRFKSKREQRKEEGQGPNKFESEANVARMKETAETRSGEKSRKSTAKDPLKLDCGLPSQEKRTPIHIANEKIKSGNYDSWRNGRSTLGYRVASDNNSFNAAQKGYRFTIKTRELRRADTPSKVKSLILSVYVIPNGQEESIPVYVGKGFDEVVILGTNALERFNMKLVQGCSRKRTQQSNKLISSSESENDETRAEVKLGISIPKKLLSIALTDKAKKLMFEVYDFLVVTDSELTQTDLVVQEIDNGEHRPLKRKNRPVSVAARKRLIKDLVKCGIVERSSSEWSSPLMLGKRFQ